jgi:hypothetical protein
MFYGGDSVPFHDPSMLRVHSSPLHISPFAIRAKDITPFQFEELNGLTLSSARKKFQSKLVQNSPRGLSWTSFD